MHSHCQQITCAHSIMHLLSIINNTLLKATCHLQWSYSLVTWHLFTHDIKQQSAHCHNFLIIVITSDGAWDTLYVPDISNGPKRPTVDRITSLGQPSLSKIKCKKRSLSHQLMAYWHIANSKKWCQNVNCCKTIITIFYFRCFWYVNIRDVNETFTFETETFESLFETRPRRDLPRFSRDWDETETINFGFKTRPPPFKTQTETFFEMLQTVQPFGTNYAVFHSQNTVLIIRSEQHRGVEIRSG